SAQRVPRLRTAGSASFRNQSNDCLTADEPMKRTWTIIGVADSCPRLLRANRRLGWNGLALSPRVECPRASLVDKSPLRQAWQRPPLVLPGRQLCGGFAKGARARQPAGRRDTCESKHWSYGGFR